MAEMAKRELIPAICKYTKFLAESLYFKKQISLKETADSYERNLVKKLTALTEDAFKRADALEKTVESIRAEKDITKRAARVRDEICPSMEALRSVIDAAETVTDKEYWPIPTYGDLLYGIF